MVPTEFQKLVDGAVDHDDVRLEIDRLTAEKKSGAELRKGPRNEVISSFVERELSRLNARRQTPAKTRSVATLDQLFVEILTEVNGPVMYPRVQARGPVE